MAKDWIVPPGGTIGILGGGQLGRMLALAAAELGLKAHIYCPEADSPASQVTAKTTRAAWTDEAGLAGFADAVDVITYEFENIPAETARFLAMRKPVYPPPAALEVSQDRLSEKSLMVDLGLAVPTFAPVESEKDIYSAIAKTGRPAILKTRRFGYDGKGQAVIRTGEEPHLAWRAVGEAPSILESFVAFEREVSVLTVRSRSGDTASYDLAENRHRQGILAETNVPAALDDETAAAAVEIGKRIAIALDYVGVLAVELFVSTGPHRLMINEIAPRVHNSFHWTQDACEASQFEQHIRAVAGWPLASTARHSDVLMSNLIGGDAGHWQALAADPSVRLHLYGKAEARPGRKMGHFNRLSRHNGR